MNYYHVLALTKALGVRRPVAAAKKITGLVNGTLAPVSVDPSIDTDMTHVDQVLALVNRLLDTVGVECAALANGESFDYCNNGETYRPTIGHHSRDGFVISSWGDAVEAANEERARLDELDELKDEVARLENDLDYARAPEPGQAADLVSDWIDDDKARFFYLLANHAKADGDQDRVDTLLKLAASFEYPAAARELLSGDRTTVEEKRIV